MFTRGRCHRQENLYPPVHVYSSDADYSSIKVMSKKNFMNTVFLTFFSRLLIVLIYILVLKEFQLVLVLRKCVCTLLCILH